MKTVIKLVLIQLPHWEKHTKRLRFLSFFCRLLLSGRKIYSKRWRRAYAFLKIFLRHRRTYNLFFFVGRQNKQMVSVCFKTLIVILNANVALRNLAVHMISFYDHVTVLSISQAVNAYILRKGFG